jgi:periplasmic protein TonB
MDYAQQQRNPLKHLIGLTLVVVLHAVLIWALVNGLAHKIVEAIKKPVEAKIVEEHKPPPPPEAPPPPPPKMEVPPPPFIPPPEIVINTPAPANTITVKTEKPPPAPVIIKTPPKVVASTKASLDRGTCSSFDPKYPPASIRNEETGSLVVHVNVDATGNPTSVSVTKSSGHPRLDEAAKSWLMTCRFRAPTVDGKPVASVLDQPYTFTLNN